MVITLIFLLIIQIICKYEPFYKYLEYSDSKHAMGRSFSNNNLFALGTSQNIVNIFNINNKTDIVSTIQEKNVEVIQFSHDARFLITENFDNEVKVWDIQTKNLITSYPKTQIKALSADDTKLAMVDQYNFNLIRIRDPKNLNILIGTLIGHNDWISSVSFSNDGQYIASSCYDNSVIIWSSVNYKIIKKLSLPTEMNSVSFSDDSRFFVTMPTTNRSQLTVWRTSDFTEVNGLKTNGYSAKFTKDGKRIIYTQDYKYIIIDSQTMQELEVINTNLQESIEKTDDDKYIAIQQLNQVNNKYYIEIWKNNQMIIEQ